MSVSPTVPPSFLPLVALSGCGLLTITFEEDLTGEFALTSDDDRYAEVVSIDPNEYEEYRDNRDRIKAGELLGVEVAILEIGVDNAATMADGSLGIELPIPDSAEFGGARFSPLLTFEDLPVARGTVIDEELPEAARDLVEEILLDDSAPLILELGGTTDEGPVAFRAEVTLRFRFTAGL